MLKSREFYSISPHERSIVEKYISDIPVRLNALAKELGVKVKVSSLGSDISGQIQRIDGVYVIKLNRYESPLRQRFTLAHELSHFLLHRRIIDQHEGGISDNVLYRSGVPENIEYEANRLAADLLMPRESLNDELLAMVDMDFDNKVDTLSKKYQASREAIRIRLT